MEYESKQLQQLELWVQLIYRTHGGGVSKPLKYFAESRHPTEQECLQAGSEIYESVYGDSPDLSEILEAELGSLSARS